MLNWVYDFDDEDYKKIFIILSYLIGLSRADSSKEHEYYELWLDKYYNIKWGLNKNFFDKLCVYLKIFIENNNLTKNTIKNDLFARELYILSLFKDNDTSKLCRNGNILGSVHYHIIKSSQDFIDDLPEDKRITSQLIKETILRKIVKSILYDFSGLFSIYIRAVHLPEKAKKAMLFELINLAYDNGFLSKYDIIILEEAGKAFELDHTIVKYIFGIAGGVSKNVRQISSVISLQERRIYGKLKF
jgi:hypothetical protein